MRRVTKASTTAAGNGSVRLDLSVFGRVTYTGDDVYWQRTIVRIEGDHATNGSITRGKYNDASETAKIRRLSRASCGDAGTRPTPRRGRPQVPIRASTRESKTAAVQENVQAWFDSAVCRMQDFTDEAGVSVSGFSIDGDQLWVHVVRSDEAVVAAARYFFGEDIRVRVTPQARPMAPG